MAKTRSVGGWVVGSLVATVVVAGLLRAWVRHGRELARPAVAVTPAVSPAPPVTPSRVDPDGAGYLYGRVSTLLGATYEGRLRLGEGGREEAFWSDVLNARKVDNPWATQVPPAFLPTRTRIFGLFGFELARREEPVDLGRPFVARFGDLVRLEARGFDVRIVLKSGTTLDLPRSESSDYDDGIRVWTATGTVDVASRAIRSIELLPTPPLAGAPVRLHGTLRTTRGELRGFIAWERRASVATDTLDGSGAQGAVHLPFDTIRAIRRTGDGAVVSLTTGAEVELTDTDRTDRGIAVTDPRYGRILVPWSAFERLDLDDAGSGPAYQDFQPGSPLTGTVTTASGEHLTGRLVFDLDESETTDLLDAPGAGLDYSLPFDLIATIDRPATNAPADAPFAVTLRTGERLDLDPQADLGPSNAGLLVFAEEGKPPAYVPWAEVQRVELAHPPSVEMAVDPRG